MIIFFSSDILMGRHLRFLPGTVFQRELILPVVKDALNDGVIVQTVTCSPTTGIGQSGVADPACEAKNALARFIGLLRMFFLFHHPTDICLHVRMDSCRLMYKFVRVPFRDIAMV